MKLLKHTYFTTSFLHLIGIILFIILCCNIPAKSDNTLDSLFNDLKKQKQDTSQIKTLFEITTQLIDEKNPLAKKYASQAINKSLLIFDSDYFNQSISLYLKAVKNEQTPIQKLHFLNQLLARIIIKDYSKKSLIYMYKALTFESIDSTIKAANMYELATQEALKSKDTLTIIDVYTSKGIFFKKKSSSVISRSLSIFGIRYIWGRTKLS